MDHSRHNKNVNNHANEVLQNFEHEIIIIEDASKSQLPVPIALSMPDKLSSFLRSLGDVPSRNHAERLLAIGVSFWNAVNAFEGKQWNDNQMHIILTRIRHVGVDCMYLAHSSLKGISERFDIDGLTLMKFYTTCGNKYAKQINDQNMAKICYEKASQFSNEIKEDADDGKLSRGMFNLLLGRAENEWEFENNDEAEKLINMSKKYINNLPMEYEFVASVEYNFGLYAYEHKDINKSLKWLRKSIETRSHGNNVKYIDNMKQSISLRLSSICLLGLQQFQQAYETMKQSENIHHDPITSFLLLKLGIITKKSNLKPTLLSVVADQNVTLQIAVGCVTLFKDANRLIEATEGFRKLFHRFKACSEAVVLEIGPKFFETLVHVGEVDEALEVLETACHLIPKFAREQIRKQTKNDDDAPIMKMKTRDAESDIECTHLSTWASMCLSAGCNNADKNEYYCATVLLNRALQLGRTLSTTTAVPAPASTDGKIKEISTFNTNVITKNEVTICRLLSSCALCCLEEMEKEKKKNTSTALKSIQEENDEIDEDKDKKHKNLLRLAIENAQRAAQLDTMEFTAKLLLFRSYVVSGDFNKAADQLKNVSKQDGIDCFGVGALVEAACGARDVGSPESVIAVLKCILSLHKSILDNNNDDTAVPNGFYGSLFVSCVGIMVADMERNNDEDIDDVVDEKKIMQCQSDILEVLESGARGVKAMGTERAFNSKNEDQLMYLTDVAWNMGRQAAMTKVYDLWEGFFKVCNQLCESLPTTNDTLRMRHKCNIMCASAAAEHAQAGVEQFKRARNYLSNAKQATYDHDQEDEVIEMKCILLLDAKCCVGCSDEIGLGQVVETAIKDCEDVITLEQLASICATWATGTAVKLRVLSMEAKVLNHAVHLRLEQGDNGKLDLQRISMCLRQLVSLELGRNESSGVAFKTFCKAVEVAEKYTDTFPRDERLWLMGVGWERAQVLMQTGRYIESKSWGCKTLPIVNVKDECKYYKQISDLIGSIS